MKTQFLLFILIFTSIMGLACFYVGKRVLARSLWAQAHRGVVWLSLGLFLLLQFLGPWVYRTVPDRSNWVFILQWITYTAMGVFACLFFYTLFADLLVLSWKALVRPKEPVDLERRSFFTVTALTGVSAAAGVVQALAGPKVQEVEVPLEGLPKEFDGFKIAQLSDLHVGPLIGRDYVEGVVGMTEKLGADLIALTGDFVDGAVEELRPALEPLTRLKAPHGTYFVTGNHEYYWGAEAWVEEFRRLGAVPLINEHRVLRKGRARLVLAGVNDLSAGRRSSGEPCDPAKALQGAPPGSVKLLLAHQPASYALASQAGFDLMLSGHTHAGQFFPWNLVVMAAQRYYKGLNRHGKMWIYVNRATGYWGPPLRFLVPSEITLLRLRKTGPPKT